MLEKIGQLVNDYKFSERDTKLCLMTFVVKLVMFWKRMLQTGLPDIKVPVLNETCLTRLQETKIMVPLQAGFIVHIYAV